MCTCNYSHLDAFIWWLSNPPKVSALLGREMGPTPSWSMVVLTCCPSAQPKLLFTRSCSSSTERIKSRNISVKDHLRLLSYCHPYLHMLLYTKNSCFYDNDMNSTCPPCKNSLWQQHLVIFTLSKNHTEKFLKFSCNLANRLACSLQVLKMPAGIWVPFNPCFAWSTTKYSMVRFSHKYEILGCPDPSSDSMQGCSLC